MIVSRLPPSEPNLQVKVAHNRKFVSFEPSTYNSLFCLKRLQEKGSAAATLAISTPGTWL
jgi:hypothetical protein